MKFAHPIICFTVFEQVTPVMMSDWRQVEVGAVVRVLEPLWQAKTETAARLRGRIEAVLDYATALGWRTGENPARWRGHLANLLPARCYAIKPRQRWRLMADWASFCARSAVTGEVVALRSRG
jgi:hypothetical protein